MCKVKRPVSHQWVLQDSRVVRWANLDRHSHAKRVRPVPFWEIFHGMVAVGVSYRRHLANHEVTSTSGCLGTCSVLRDYHGFWKPVGKCLDSSGVGVRVGHFYPSQNPYPWDGLAGYWRVDDKTTYLYIKGNSGHGSRENLPCRTESRYGWWAIDKAGRMIRVIRARRRRAGLTCVHH